MRTRPQEENDLGRRDLREPVSFLPAQKLLHEAVAERVFPGAAFGVAHRGRLLILGAVGRFTYEPDSPFVKPDTTFDVASLTKVAATTAMAMLLFERNKLDLDQPVSTLLPEFLSGDDPRRAKITLRMLLAHCSGMPAYVKLFERHRDRESLLRAAIATPLAAEPGSRAEYSDIGFMVLGAALEHLAGEPLDTFCDREVFGPLLMNETCFTPAADFRSAIPPTEQNQPFRKGMVQGEVNDENAFVMGGVAGHAGLFSSAGNLLRFGCCLFGQVTELYMPETVQVFTSRAATPAGSSRALGWDTPSSPSQSGTHFSARSFGHLGFTGTSLWVDADREIVIVLLTNRTWPDRSSQEIKQVRPAFHDAVMSALLRPAADLR